MEIQTEVKLIRKRMFIVGDREFDSIKKAEDFLKEIEEYKKKHFCYLEYSPSFCEKFSFDSKTKPELLGFKKKQILMADSLLGLISYLKIRFEDPYVEKKGVKFPILSISDRIEIRSYEDYLKLIRTPISTLHNNKNPKLIKIDEYGEVKK